MAASSPLRPFSLLLLAVVLFSAVLLGAAPASASARLDVTQVANPDSNQEMQDLGRFSVDEYNERREDESSPVLSFSSVKEAESKEEQDGLRYYIRVETNVQGGVHREFNAVVVVKSDGSRDLVNFEPCEANKSP